MKQRIADLIQRDGFRIAVRTVESFGNRLDGLTTRAQRLPFVDGNAFQCVLYGHLEKVLMCFEELEWLGPQSGPVLTRDRASEAIHAYGVRFNKIEARLDRIPVEQKLATSTILHRELGQALDLFERHRWLRKGSAMRNPTLQARLRWN
jgi:hypothetical protein